MEMIRTCPVRDSERVIYTQKNPLWLRTVSSWLCRPNAQWWQLFTIPSMFLPWFTVSDGVHRKTERTCNLPIVLHFVHAPICWSIDTDSYAVYIWFLYMLFLSHIYGFIFVHFECALQFSQTMLTPDFTIIHKGMPLQLLVQTTKTSI